VASIRKKLGHIEFWWEKQDEVEHAEKLGVDGRIYRMSLERW
jgi:hypothetical protein